MRKIASRWVPHDLTEMQKWLRYDDARNHVERYEREGEAFLRRNITLDETPTAHRQCSILLFIFGTQPATSFEKEAATLSAEPIHHFAGHCSAACSASCG